MVGQIGIGIASFRAGADASMEPLYRPKFRQNIEIWPSLSFLRSRYRLNL